MCLNNDYFTNNFVVENQITEDEKSKGNEKHTSLLLCFSLISFHLHNKSLFRYNGGRRSRNDVVEANFVTGSNKNH